MRRLLGLLLICALPTLAWAEPTTIKVPPGKTIKIVSAPDGTVTITVDDVDPVEPTPPPPRPLPTPTRCWLVVVEETAEALANRGNYYADRNLRAYLSAKGWKQRLADKDVKDRDGKQPRDLAPYLAVAQNKVLPFFWLVDQDGTIRAEGPLPGTPTELLTVLRRVGGE